MKGIRNSTSASFLDILIQQILELCGNFQYFNWKVLSLEVQGQFQGKGIRLLEDRIEQYSDGYDALCDLGRSTNQIFEMKLVSTGQFSSLVQIHTLLELVDSSYWELFLSDNNLLESIFENATQNLSNPYRI